MEIAANASFIKPNFRKYVQRVPTGIKRLLLFVVSWGLFLIIAFLATGELCLITFLVESLCKLSFFHHVVIVLLMQFVILHNALVKILIVSA